MADTDLLDYEDEEEQQQQATDGAEAGKEVKTPAGGYVSIHSSGFRDFLLKPELLRAIVDCGFEHPSEGGCRANFSYCSCVHRKHLIRASSLNRVWILLSTGFSNPYICFQFNMNAFRKLYSEWTSYARQNLAWEKLQFSFWHHCSSSSPSTARFVRPLLSFCIIFGNLHFLLLVFEWKWSQSFFSCQCS